MILSLGSSFVIVNGIEISTVPIFGLCTNPKSNMSTKEKLLILFISLSSCARGHPDHTLITYPGLGHYFYPEDYWSIAMRPIQGYMLQDLEAWLKEPARKIYSLDSQLQTAEKSVEELQGQLDELNSEFDQNISELENQVEDLRSESTDLKHIITELEDHNVELKSEQDSVKKLAYISLEVAIIVLVAVAIVLFQRHRL